MSVRSLWPPYGETVRRPCGDRACLCDVRMMSVRASYDSTIFCKLSRLRSLSQNRAIAELVRSDQSSILVEPSTFRKSARRLPLVARPEFEPTRRGASDSESETLTTRPRRPSTTVDVTLQFWLKFGKISNSNFQLTTIIFAAG